MIVMTEEAKKETNEAMQGLKHRNESPYQCSDLVLSAVNQHWEHEMAQRRLKNRPRKGQIPISPAHYKNRMPTVRRR